MTLKFCKDCARLRHVSPLLRGQARQVGFRTATMKPLLQKRPSGWICYGSLLFGEGKTPLEAYRNWWFRCLWAA